jgi:Ran GTPase-activating protein (RanGAP) involved in mRNA processing and transport
MILYEFWERDINMTKFIELHREFLKKIENNDFHQETLYLDSLEITDEDISLLMSSLKKNIHIKHLILSDNYISNLGAMALANLGADDFSKVKRLDLSRNYIQQQGAQFLAKGHFEALILNGNPLGDDGIKYFSDNTTLLELGASECGITDIGVSEILKNETINTLNLGYNRITVESLKKLGENNQLIHLCLNENALGDVGIEYLAENKVLKSLHLCNNQLGNEGAKKIADGFPSLEELWLTSNKVGNEGAIALSKHPQLRRVCLIENETDQITEIILNQDDSTESSEFTSDNITKELEDLILINQKESQINIGENDSSYKALTYHFKKMSSSIALPAGSSSVQLNNVRADMSN